MRMIIIGCGRLGAGLAQALTLRHRTVTVVDSNSTAFGLLGSSFKGRTVAGMGYDREVLLQAGIERTDGLAAVTSSDDVNVVAARIARRIFRVPRVVARLYDPRKSEIYRRLGVQTIATTTWGINRIVELLTFSHLEAIQSLGSGEVDLFETAIPHRLVGRTVHDMTVPGAVQVVAISRAGKAFLPTPATVFHEGDLIHVAVQAAAVDRLRALLEPA